MYELSFLITKAGKEENSQKAKPAIYFLCPLKRVPLLMGVTSLWIIGCRRNISITCWRWRRGGDVFGGITEGCTIARGTIIGDIIVGGTIFQGAIAGGTIVSCTVSGGVMGGGTMPS